MEPVIQNLEIVVWVMASFAIAKALSTFLVFISEKTKNTWDNKVAKSFGWVIGLVGKLIDQFIGNSRND